MYKSTLFNSPLKVVFPTRTAYLDSFDYTDTLTRKMAEFSYDRMQKHRALVLENIKKILTHDDLAQSLLLSATEFENFKKKLIANGENHDLSKFLKDEKQGYVYLNWKFHLEKDRAQKYEYPTHEIKQEVDQAILHHLKNNPHHPDYFYFKKDTDTLENNKEKIKELLKNMDDLYLFEMVADWMAISQEYKTSCIDYANETIGDDKRRPFSEAQKIKIIKLINLFEPAPQVHNEPSLLQEETSSIKNIR